MRAVTRGLRIFSGNRAQMPSALATSCEGRALPLGKRLDGVTDGASLLHGRAAFTGYRTVTAPWGGSQ
jgi:hypothetical protein